ncbi:MAG: CRISPR-associated protein Cas4 [Thermoplasmata archaeon]|nr:MAG: CRISPR-associated protein Cas4 [Thermoplasmata archaeon]RLF64154.1 MAG: CRISPR-associated protein Cas4 [Thermoplasmata archaeon]
MRMDEMISAGDIEKYAYCPLSWWLSKQDKKVDSLEGVKSHEREGEELEDIRKKEVKKAYYNKLILALAVSASLAAVIGIIILPGVAEKENDYVFIVFSLIWLLNSIFFLYRAERISIVSLKLRYEKAILLSSMGAILIALIVILSSLPSNEEFSKFLEILALLWIVLANIIFYRSINLSEELLIKKLRYVSSDDNIAYIGIKKESPMLESSRYGIRGKPDYIIEKDGEYIPVEKKTGRTPKGPLFSHIVQLIAYCMLVEETFGKVEYGILEYDERKYFINYDERLKNTVIKLRENLVKDLKRGEAHRNHNREGKCMNCSRRDICPERLA